MTVITNSELPSLMFGYKIPIIIEALYRIKYINYHTVSNHFLYTRTITYWRENIRKLKVLHLNCSGHATISTTNKYCKYYVIFN